MNSDHAILCTIPSTRVAIFSCHLLSILECHIFFELGRLQLATQSRLDGNFVLIGTRYGGIHTNASRTEKGRYLASSLSSCLYEYEKSR